MQNKIHGVIVTYKPEMVVLEKCIYSLKDQLSKIIIVDNTPAGCRELERFKAFPNIEVIYLNDNYGIAYAQNVGIKKALEEKADYILLSDQDTVYPENYIERMLNALNSYHEKNKVAGISPVYKDVNRNEISHFIKHSKFGFKKIYAQNGIYEISQAIASGLIIVSKHLKEIGLMDEKLFLYLVDLEWCWRAIYHGYKLLGNADACIMHREGNITKKLLWKTLPIRNPVSHYYVVRNGIYLGTRCKFINFPKKIHILRKTLLILVGIIMLSDDKFKNLKYTLKGFYHGIIGKLGKLDEPH